MTNTLKGLSNFFSITFVTLALFPILVKADHYLIKMLPVEIPSPDLLLLLTILIPIILKNHLKKNEASLIRTYQNTLLISLPLLLVALVSVAWSLHPTAVYRTVFEETYRYYRFLLMDFYHWLYLMISFPLAHSLVIRKHNRIIFFFIMLGASAAIWTDIVFPGTFSDLETRAAGFAQNSNWGGRIIIFLAIASIQWEKNNLMNLLIFTISGLVVFATLSVGCLLLYFMVLGIYIILKLKRLKGENILVIVVMIPASILLLLVFVVQPVMQNLMDNSDAFSNKDSQERINQIIGMTQGNFDFAIDHSRAQLVNEYWELIEESPLVGRGTGFSLSLSKSPHNIYLKHWVENGLLGLLAYLTFNVCAFLHFNFLKDTRGMVFTFTFFVAGFFDHNILHYKTFIIIVAILGGLAFLDQPKRTPLAKTSNGVAHINEGREIQI